MFNFNHFMFIFHLVLQIHRDKGNDYSDHCKTRIRKVEKILRLSLISHDAIYNEEGPTQHRQRLTVYSRLISLFNIYCAQGHLLLFIENDFDELQNVIKRLESISAHHLIYKKKDRLRYSVEFIIEGIKRLIGLKKESEKLDAILKKCQAALNGDSDVKDVQFQQMFSEEKTDWFTAHVTLIYLHSQVRFRNRAKSSFALLGSPLTTIKLSYFNSCFRCILGNCLRIQGEKQECLTKKL